MQSCMTHRRAPRAGSHAVDVVARSRAVEGFSALIGRKRGKLRAVDGRASIQPGVPF